VVSGFLAIYPVALCIMDRTALVEKLVTTLHLNVAERQLLGPEPICYEEIASAVMRVFGKTGWFPPNARPAQTGHSVFEGYFLQRLPDGGARLWLQRPYPVDPTAIADQQHEDFADAERAIDNFVSREWGRSGIDGIPIRD
jgi:hypothetical protein